MRDVRRFHLPNVIRVALAVDLEVSRALGRSQFGPD
jgi:hypothetical protein